MLGADPTRCGLADVFLSYAHEAPEPTVKVEAELANRGFSVWYDRRLLPGDAFAAVIEDQIARARAVVVIWTPQAAASRWVRAEARRALDHDKLVAVCTAEVRPEALPLPFNDVKTSPIDDWDAMVAALSRLGVHPDASPQADAAAAAVRDAWELVSDTRDATVLERFLARHGATEPVFRVLAEDRIASLKAGARPVRRATDRPDNVSLKVEATMHTAPIKRISVTANGRWLATGSDDKTVRLWALESGALERVYRWRIGPTAEGRVYAVALDPAGQWLAAGGYAFPTDSQFVTVFDAATGGIRARIGPLPNGVTELAVSADGTRLAAGLFGRNGIRVWETEHWGEVWADTSYGDDVLGLTFASDLRLATSSGDGFVRVHAPDGRVSQRAIPAGGVRPFGLAFDPSGTHLAVGYFDQPRLDVLSAVDLALVVSPDLAGLEGGNLGQVTWLQDGRLAAGGRHNQGDCPVFVWEDGGRGARLRWPGPRNTVSALAAVPGGGVVYGGSDPAAAHLSADGRVQRAWGPPMADLRVARRGQFRVSSDGKRVWFGLKDWGADPVLFDLSTLSLTTASVAPDNVEGADQAGLPIEGWADTPAPTLRGTPLPLGAREISRSLAVDADGRGFVLGTEWMVRRYDHRGVSVWEQPAPGIVWGVLSAQAGRLVVAACGDGTVRWYAGDQGGRELLALFVHMGEAGTEWVAFTPDGYFVASARGRKLVGWHVNRGPEEPADFFPVDTFAEVYEQRDRVQRALD